MRDAGKRLLALAALGEAATGLALLLAPALVARLLLGLDDPTGVALVIARVAGIALIGLGVACWPGSTALAGMLAYSGILTLYLALVGLGGAWVGVLLWPAVVFHTTLTGLLAWAWLRDRPPVG